MQDHEGKVQMVGRGGLIWVSPDDVPAWEREGYWLKSKIPQAQKAPGDPIPADFTRGCPLDKEDAEF